MKLLVVAADPMEFAGILRNAGSPARLPGPVRVGLNELLLLARGVGARRAAEAVDAGLAFGPDAVLSTGFCGALDPALAVADIVVATKVVDQGGKSYDALPVPGGRRRAVCSLDHVVQTAAEKRRLAGEGFGAVEMEAGGVAARAGTLPLPFYCIRAVTDLAGEDMANDFNSALTADGHFDTMKLLRSSIRRPLARIPELLRFRKRCIRAAGALGDFLADCRF